MSATTVAAPPGGRRPPAAAPAPARAGGDRRRDEPRRDELQDVLEDDDVLVDPRPDDLPARVRPRPRARSWSRSRGWSTSQFVGTGMVATAILFSSVVLGDVRRLHQAPLPAHVRRDPRRAGRRRGARDRRGRVARNARRHLRDGAAARDDAVRARPVVGDAARAVHRRADRRSGSPGSACSRRPRCQQDRQLQLHPERADHAAVPRLRHVLPDRGAAAGGRRSRRTSTRSTTASSWSGTRCSGSRRAICSTCWCWSRSPSSHGGWRSGGWRSA